MFTNLIGFIKPLLKKNPAQATAASKVRATGEHDARHSDEFEELLDIDIQADPDARHTKVVAESHDEIELSLAAIRHLVDTSDEPADIKKEAWAILADFERKGRETLPFNTGRPVIDQLRAYKNNPGENT